jgi:3-carboxy-cis,cis-muconate cycloisomerase
MAPNDLADALYSTAEMAALFSGAGHVRRMLDFEGALARAETRAGVIPQEAAPAISAACDVAQFDVTALLRETATAGTLAIPLAKALTARVGGEAGRYVHWGATSQDVIDTALMLQMRDGIDVLLRGLLVLGADCAALAQRHRATPMAGRTLLQQALPITFGLRAARWLGLVTRQAARLRVVRAETLALQFGGAAGTLASLGTAGRSAPQADDGIAGSGGEADTGDDIGARVADLLGKELDLPVPSLPWHAERDRIAEVAAALGIVAGAVGKIAQDILLLSQTELGEVAEGAAPGKGGSSTLPHKRNPVDTVAAVAAARLAQAQVPVLLASMIQEHERAVGGWQAEWAALPGLFCATGAAVERVRLAVSGLEVDAARMRANLDITRGLLMAESLSMVLAAHLGKQEAHHVVQAACNRAVERGSDLESVARADPQISAALSADQITAALDPAGYLGSSGLFINRALADFTTLQGADA